MTIQNLEISLFFYRIAWGNIETRCSWTSWPRRKLCCYRRTVHNKWLSGTTDVASL